MGRGISIYALGDGRKSPSGLKPRRARIPTDFGIAVRIVDYM